ncbi:unnamed protein product [Sphagnum jensenii]|uniref:Uncharacterized protein n=1 Tax=Sphagnum jensenii TaxID=128206 RepID=A0ABP1AJ67_9BRYO
MESLAAVNPITPIASSSFCSSQAPICSSCSCASPSSSYSSSSSSSCSDFRVSFHGGVVRHSLVSEARVLAAGELQGRRRLQTPQRQQNLLNGGPVITAYLERNVNPVGDFFNRIRGSLPIVGLVSRILSDEGGVGNDRIQFVEFCRKVEKSCSADASRAFYSFTERHGTAAKAQYVLVWCWAAALGAGLLKSDDLLMGASRLRVSYDIQYEIENLELLMDEAAKKRAKSNAPAIDIPMEVRAEKALDAICKCCIGANFIAEDDVPLLTSILTTVFPSADALEVERIVESRLPDTQVDASNSLQPTQDLSSEEEVVQDMASSSTQ